MKSFKVLLVFTDNTHTTNFVISKTRKDANDCAKVHEAIFMVDNKETIKKCIKYN
jgi:hypothetical protein